MIADVQTAVLPICGVVVVCRAVKDIEPDTSRAVGESDIGKIAAIVECISPDTR